MTLQTCDLASTVSARYPNMDTRAFLVFGSFGFSLFRLGKKRGQASAIGFGVALMVFPYFVENIWAMWCIGRVLLFFGWKSTQKI